MLHLFSDHKEMFAGDILWRLYPEVVTFSEITWLKHEIEELLCLIRWKDK